MRLYEFLTEVESRHTRNKGTTKYRTYDHPPLKDSSTIRVYHGVRDYSDLVGFLKHGFSGKSHIGRTHSYENDNNPKGLFVTPDLDVAKEFTSSFIIEFHAPVSELEAPVWPSGSYTGQGQMAQYFGGDESKREQARIDARKTAIKTNQDYITKSDRPELAHSLSGGETQALFTGDMNPNSIRAVWVRKPNTYKEYERHNTKDFKQSLMKGNIKSAHGTKVSWHETGDDKYKLFKPRENATLDEMLVRLNKDGYMKDDDVNWLKDVLAKGHIDPNQYLWPTQVQQIKQELLKNGYKLNHMWD